MFESLEDRRLLASFPAPVSSWEKAEIIDDEVLVKLAPSVTPQQQFEFRSILTSYGALERQTWDELNMSHVKFFFPHGRVATLEFAKTLHELSFVEYAEPNFVRHIQRVPNDPQFFPMWGLHNGGQPSPYPPGNAAGDPFGSGTVDADIDAPEAWDITTGSPNVVVAVIDTGVDYTHPDLAANIWTNPFESPDGIDNDGNGFVDDIFGFDTFDLDNDPRDEEGHGTHVAGTVAAVGDNGIGVTGVSWNSKIMAIKASNPGGAFSSASIVGAQMYITRMKVQHGINIVASNNSYGGLGAALFSFAEFDAIRQANNAGIAFIAAAGNQAVNIDNPNTPAYPAAYNLPGIVSVAATDRNDDPAVFTNTGFNNVDIAAPGVAILSTYPTNLGLPAGQPPAPNTPPPIYAFNSGTSMASPMVAGAWAIIKSVAPQLSIAQIKNLIMNTVDVIPALQFTTQSGGRLNLAKALDGIPRNSISGTVWQDLDGDARFDAGEPGHAGVTVYVDRNNNGVLDGAEPSTVSLASGAYNLRSQLGAGTYRIREIVPQGYTQTFPGPSNNFAHTIVLTTGIDSQGNLNFGNRPAGGSISGLKYLDIDAAGNTLGQRDPGEPGLADFVIYVDVNNDGMIGVGEPASITDSQGRFQINNVLPGSFIVREVQRPGFIQTEPDPAGPFGGGRPVVVIGGETTSGVVFGNSAAIDWGDAPASYGTLSANNGARHGFLPGFFLGDANDTTSSHIDPEANGVPSANADGDDLNNADDEDGVSFLTDIVPGENATIRVSVSSGSYGAGILQGWIDFNNDGDFGDAGEQILRDRSLVTGTHLFTFAVPASAAVADTYARFRWSLERGLGPRGSAVGGEVEDYTTAARAVAPTANDDGPFIAGRDTNFVNNQFDVLANDFAGVGGLPFTFFNVDSTTARGGLVQIDTANNTLRYQPPAGYTGPDSFQYSITDGTNVSADATVRINVVPLDPIAVDDTFDIAVGSALVPLNVVANDVPGVGGPLTIVARSNPTAGGTVTIDQANNRLIYTPPSPTFTGADTFTYFVTDDDGASASANVLVQVGSGPAPNQIVEISFKVFDDLGNELGVGGTPAPTVGDTVTLAAFTRDLRGSFPDPVFPTQFPDASGVLSAYADVLFDSSVVRPVPDNNPFGIEITFGPLYTSFQSATSSVPGIVDEAGAADTDFEYALGSGENLLYTINFTVLANGSLRFLGNPEEDSAQFTFETQVHSDVTGLPIVVPNSDIFFNHSPNIQIGPNSEGEATNAFNPLDVNQDTLVTPNDALLVVNHLNRFGAGTYTPMLAAALGQGIPQFFLDVNADGRVSAFDAKLVVDHLNLKASQQNAAAAEGEADNSLLVSQALGSTGSSGTASSPSADSTSEDYAQSVDQVLSGDLGGSAISPVVADPADEIEDKDEDTDERDDLFAAW